LVFFQQVISYTFSFFPEKWKILWYFIKKDLTRGRDVPLIVPSLEPGLAQRTNRFSGMFGWPVALWEWLYGISSDAALCICQVTGQPSVLYYAATIFQVLTYCCFCKCNYPLKHVWVLWKSIHFRNSFLKKKAGALPCRLRKRSMSRITMNVYID